MMTTRAIDDDLRKQHQVLYITKALPRLQPLTRATCADARTRAQTSAKFSASEEADANLTMNILAAQVCMNKLRQDRCQLKQHNNKQI